MRASILFLAFLMGGIHAHGGSDAVPSIGFDLSLEFPVPLASPIADATLESFAFGDGQWPLELRTGDVFEVPRFPTCDFLFNLRNDLIHVPMVKNPMTLERIEAFWVPITGQVDSVLVVQFHDRPSAGRTRL